MPNAWEEQSKSLVEVQKLGTGLEKTVREILGWTTGKVKYDFYHHYKIQVDCVYPSAENPKTIVSVTYTKPDTRGHSNENKFQLKVGELTLLKNAYPELRVVLVIGGSENSWLPYVLEAFQFFFDEVIFLWKPESRERLRKIGKDPNSVQLNHQDFWGQLKVDWETRQFFPEDFTPPSGAVRYLIADVLRNQTPHVHHPNLIQNEIARVCMHRSKINQGKEWEHFLAGRWHAIEMSRNFFNPVEAAVEISLKASRLDFSGGIAQDVPVHSLLHDLGMSETSVSEDFVLFSENLNLPVYIQCKSSGGGRSQHGKNIQNRTKEQVARSLIYRSGLGSSENLILKPKNFHWISVLDGNWGVTRSQPLKYLHMLQMAGYDKIIGAAELLKENLDVKRNGNPLIEYLVENLACRMNGGG